jgi:outer membrane immunogenic protein
LIRQLSTRKAERFRRWRVGLVKRIDEEIEMSVIRTLGASLAVLVAGTGMAAAADIPGYVPPPAEQIYTPAPAFSWTGPYLGVQGGYGWAQSRIADTANTIGASGWQGGAYAGYNFQFNNNVVLGLEGDVNISGHRGTNAGESIANPWNGSVRARAGYAVDRFMPYVTGGLAFGSLRANDGLTSETATKAGWTVGAGVEAAVTDNVTARLEVRHTDLGTHTFGNVGPTTYTSNDVMVGVGFKF